jgi:hypothetical protein
MRDGQVVECRVFIEDLCAFDQFWARMPRVGAAPHKE